MEDLVFEFEDEGIGGIEGAEGEAYDDELNMDLDDLDSADDSSSGNSDEEAETPQDFVLSLMGDDFEASNLLKHDMEEDIDVEELQYGEEEASLSISLSNILVEEVDVLAELEQLFKFVDVQEEALFGTDASFTRAGECVLDKELFKGCDSNWLDTLGNVLRDVVSDDIDAGVDDPGMAVKRVLDIMWDTTGWVPRSNRERFIGCLNGQYKKFYGVMSTEDVKSSHDLGEYFDRGRFEAVKNCIKVNVGCLGWFTSITNDLKSKDRVHFVYRSQDPLAESIYAGYSGKRRDMSVADWIAGLYDFFVDERIMNVLRLNEEQVRAFSFGELLRRLLVGEIMNGTLDMDRLTLDVLSNVPQETFIKILRRQSKGGSSVCQVILLLACVIENVYELDETQFDGWNPALFVIREYLKCIDVNPAYMRIVSYCGVSERDDGGYMLEYPLVEDAYGAYAGGVEDIGDARGAEGVEGVRSEDDENSVDGANSTDDGKDDGGIGEVESDDLLCLVVGSGSNNYVIPLMVEDSVRGYIVLPPVKILDALRRVTVTPQYTRDEEYARLIRYVYIPTLEWVSMQGVLVRKCDNEKDSLASKYDARNMMLSDMVFSYKNEFEDGGEEFGVSKFVLPRGMITAVHVTTRNDGDVYNIAIYENEVGGVKRFVPVNGSCVLECDGGLVLNYMLDSGIKVETYDRGEYSVEVVNYDAVVRDSEATEVDKYVKVGDIPQMSGDIAHNLKYLPVICERLCVSTGYDLDDLLEVAQKCIYVDLYYVCSIGAIDELAACRVLEVYKSITGDEKDQSNIGRGFKNDFNMETAGELLTMVLDAGHELYGAKVWCKENEEVMRSLIEKCDVTVADVCRRLDRLDLMTLALQVMGKQSIPARGRIDEEEARMKYLALRYVPGVRERLQYLEFCMVIVQLSFKERESVGDLIQRDAAIRKLFRNGRCSDSIFNTLRRMKQTGLRGLVSKEELKGVTVLKMFYALNRVDGVASSKVLLKYFILSRDVKGIVGEFEGIDEGKARDMKEFLGFRGDDIIRAMSDDDFYDVVTTAKVERFMERFRELFVECVYAGLYSEVSEGGQSLELLTADLTIDLSRFIHRFSEKEVEDAGGADKACGVNGLYSDEFIQYMNSFMVSYCPVGEDIVADIDGGKLFNVLYKDSRDSFLLPKDFTLGELPLVDLRNSNLE